jgi:enamine deaminase RidA (YjgF/YER057c/UK114 family)
MLKKRYSQYTAENNPFDLMCKSLLSQIVHDSNVIKIVFFGLTRDNKQYLTQLKTLSKIMADFFPGRIPPYSLVSQIPESETLTAEVVSLEASENAIVNYGTNYIVIDNGICRELITGGILPQDINQSYSSQSQSVFNSVGEILIRENFPVNSIIRKWNYIENISSFNGEYQNYQVFNDARSHFFANVDWSGGYPAATGIGTYAGGIMVEIIAVTGDNLINKAIDNPLQVAAHKYSQSVLFGELDSHFQQRTTPKFERARIVGLPNNNTIYISGTAAIRGEKSIIADDIIEQANITMQNIEFLISSKNSAESYISCEYQLLRVYVKKIGHLEKLRNYMNLHYPHVKKNFIGADICRDELLLEIEGVALAIY